MDKARLIASVRRISRPRKVSVVALLIAVAGTVYYGAVTSTDSHPARAGAADRRQVMPIDKAGGPHFALEPPAGIRANSYRDIATATTQSGQRARLFVGNLEADGRACIGVRTTEGIGMACGVDLSGNVALQAHETTFHGHKMLSGLVSADVTSVVVTNVQGHDIRVQVHNGTFFFDGGNGDAILAYDAQGRVLGRYQLER